MTTSSPGTVVFAHVALQRKLNIADQCFVLPRLWHGESANVYSWEWYAMSLHAVMSVFAERPGSKSPKSVYAASKLSWKHGPLFVRFWKW